MKKQINNYMITNIPDDLWTATKVMTALMHTNLKTFILEAMKEKLAREKEKMKTEQNLK